MIPRIPAHDPIPEEDDDDDDQEDFYEDEDDDGEDDWYTHMRKETRMDKFV